MWGYLKDVLFTAPSAHLAELKSRIAQDVLNVTPEALRSVVKDAGSRFKLVANNGGKHIEHVLRQTKFKNLFDGRFSCGFWPLNS
ncbi:uncharacterized protein TNCV_973061 [Trichonephila clavipes]|nr:uncharacterized protein TNCV_973061 [Trichonephila clavipes]